MVRTRRSYDNRGANDGADENPERPDTAQRARIGCPTLRDLKMNSPGGS
jgi:hypothetical protein